jgi:dihydroorotate dehydrogenase (fumarate)
MVSAIYKEGVEVITQAGATLGEWMDKHGYATIEDFRGKLCQSHVPNPAFYERVQFLKHFGQL